MGEHSEYRIYDECGHEHREGDPGTTEVNDVGICCEEGYMYSLCEKCHTHDGECHEDSPMEQAWPCDAAVAQAKVKELEETYQAAVKRIDELLGEVEQGGDRAKELEEDEAGANAQIKALEEAFEDQTAYAKRLERELLELRAERDAWRRSLVEEEAESE